jgi:hypothetical protein
VLYIQIKNDGNCTAAKFKMIFKELVLVLKNKSDVKRL